MTSQRRMIGGTRLEYIGRVCVIDMISGGACVSLGPPEAKSLPLPTHRRDDYCARRHISDYFFPPVYFSPIAYRSLFRLPFERAR